MNLWGSFLFYQDICYLYFSVNQIFVKINSDNQNMIKPVGVVEAYTTKISYLYWKFSDILVKIVYW